MMIDYQVVCRICGSANLNDMGFIGGFGYKRRFYCPNCKSMWKLEIALTQDLYAEFEHNNMRGNKYGN